MAEKETKEFYEASKKFFSNKRVQWIITAIILLAIVFTATTMRLSNLPLLVDHTSGNYTLADPDAFYWLRLEQHLLQSGNLNGIDTMRAIPLNVTYSHELLIYVIADTYQFISSFNHSVTLQFIDAVYPAYASFLALIIFFFLVYVLTNSKSAAILASAFLAYSPAFLFRTISGVSGHEALGIVFMFAAFLSFVLGLKNFHKNWKSTILWGILVGFLVACSFTAWNGTSNFMFLTMSSVLLLYYFFHITGEENVKIKQKLIAFFFLWVFVSLLSTILLHSSPSSMITSILTPSGILIPAGLLFIIIDIALSHYGPSKKSKFRVLISAIATLVIGIIGLEVVGKGGFRFIASIYQSLIHPLGTARVALTVAYYAQPYLTDFQSQVTLLFFWIFMMGIAVIWIDFIKGVRSMKQKVYLSIAGIAAIFGLVFSRYSASSILDGVNALSQLIYIASFAIFLICLVWIYRKEKHKIGESMIFTFCWMLVMLITIRAAERTIFLVVPFMALAGGILVAKTASYTKKAKGHDRAYLIGAILVLALIFSFISLFGNPLNGNPGSYTLSSLQASQVGPLTNDQWENAMAWVRNTTAPGSIFLSWWDYGYQIQTIGQRPTVLDGQNYDTYWDHLMGRYVLTTPNPNSALAFMKSQNVSYLLIDPTDFGKYAAFSSIGSDSTGLDRFAAPTVLSSSSAQDYPSANGTTMRVFQGTTFVDQDISYGNVFLPGPTAASGQAATYNAYLIGTIMQYVKSNNSIQLISQPQAVFQYNGQQYQIPIRYLYYQGQIQDFQTGINATFVLIPSVNPTGVSGQITIDPIGAGIYLSPKVQQSLYARLYILNDYYHQYPTLTTADFEQNDIIQQLNQRGAFILSKFAYYQGNLLAPLEIWQVSYPSNMLNLPDFRKQNGQYADLDNLTLTSS